MAIINSYPLITPKLTDLILGTSAGSNGRNKTASFTVSALQNVLTGITSITSTNVNTIVIGGNAKAATIGAVTAVIAQNGPSLATGGDIYTFVTTNHPGTVSGTGTADTLTKWSANGIDIENSSITDVVNGATVTITNRQLWPSGQGLKDLGGQNNKWKNLWAAETLYGENIALTGTNTYISLGGSTGAVGQVLTSGGTGVSATWTDNGNIGGTGTINTVPIFTGTTAIGNSLISQASNTVIINGSGTDGRLQLNCSAGTHGVTIQSPPHSASATYTLILPQTTGAAGQVLTSGGGATDQLAWATNGNVGGTGTGEKISKWTGVGASTILGDSIMTEQPAAGDFTASYIEVSGAGGLSTQNAEINGWLLDSANSKGTTGQLLSSTGSVVNWIDPPGVTSFSTSNTNLITITPGTTPHTGAVVATPNISGGVSLASNTLATGTQIQNAINTALAGAVTFKGTFDAGTGAITSGGNLTNGGARVAVAVGDMYVVSIAGNFYGSTLLNIGDEVIAVSAAAAGTSADTDWNAVPSAGAGVTDISPGNTAIAVSPSTGSVVITSTAFAGGSTIGHVPSAAAASSGQYLDYLGNWTTLPAGDTYTLQAGAKAGTSIPLQLDATVGSDSTVNLTEGNGITLTQTSSSEITIDAAVGVTGSGTVDIVPLWTPTSTVLGNSVIAQSSTNIGIGTTTPVSILDAKTSTSTVLTANTSGFTTVGDGTGFGVYRSNTGRQSGYSWLIDSTASSGGASASEYQTDNISFNIRKLVTDANLTEAMTITSAGNVGIGTTGPSAKLHVVGNTGGVDVTTRFEPQSNNAKSILYLSNRSSGDGGYYYDSNNNLSGLFAYGDYTFNVGTSNIGGTIGDPRMIIKQGGNVGIGTTSPAYKLDISGSFRATSESTFRSNLLFPDNARIRFGDNSDFNLYRSSTASYLASYDGDILIDNHADDKDIILRGDDGSGGLTEYLRLDGSTTNAYFLNPGNVGIGTTSPAFKTQLYDSGNTVLGITAGTANYAALQFGSTADATRGAIEYYTGDDSLRLKTGNNSEKVRITSAGNVGINETNPSTAKLVIETGSGSGIDLYRSATNANFEAFRFRDSTNANTEASIGWSGDQLRLNSTNNTVFTTGGTERMRITSAGKVGINETNPTASLHVVNSNAIGESIAIFEALSAKNGYVYINGDDNRRKSLVFQSGGVDKFSMGVGDSDELSESTFFIGAGKGGGSNADFVITSAGNVGIGTTTPNAKLHVNSGGSGIVTSFQSGATNINEYAGITLTSGYDAYGSEIRSINTASTPGYLNPRLGLFTQDLSTYLPAGRTEKLSILGNGNVGIGTTTPTAPLSFGKAVYGAPSSEDFFRIKFQDFGGIHNDVGIGQTASGSLGFNTEVGGITSFNRGTAGEQMRIGSTGQVKFNAYISGTFDGTAAANLAVDSSGNIITEAAGGGGLAVAEVAAGATVAAAASTLYVFTASSGSVSTLTLPANPTVGDTIKISNIGGLANIVGANTNNIMGVSTDMTIDVAASSFELIWTGISATGWVILSNV